MPTRCLQVVGLNLLIGYAGHSFVDNAGHIGGLLGGAALMLLAGPRYRWATRGAVLSLHCLLLCIWSYRKFEPADTGGLR
jgi:hypothetical protein